MTGPDGKTDHGLDATRPTHQRQIMRNGHDLWVIFNLNEMVSFAFVDAVGYVFGTGDDGHLLIAWENWAAMRLLSTAL